MSEAGDKSAIGLVGLAVMGQVRAVVYCTLWGAAHDMVTR